MLELNVIIHTNVLLMFLKISITTTVMHITTMTNNPSDSSAWDSASVDADGCKCFLMYLKTSMMNKTDVREEKMFFVKDVMGEN